jgi:hypothetical protein
MSRNEFLRQSQWSELSKALSEEHLEQSGMTGVKANAQSDEAFTRLRTYLVKAKRASWTPSQKIVKKLA